MDILGLRSKGSTSHCGQLQLARGVVWGDLEGHTLAYTDGSVRQRQGSATALTVLGEATRQNRLHYATSSAMAEMGGVRFGLNLLLLLEPPHELCSLLCDSRVALPRIREGDPRSLLVWILRDKVARLAQRGVRMWLLWVPGHIGLEGDERADELAADAH